MGSSPSQIRVNGAVPNAERSNPKMNRSKDRPLHKARSRPKSGPPPSYGGQAEGGPYMSKKKPKSTVRSGCATRQRRWGLESQLIIKMRRNIFVKPRALGAGQFVKSRLIGFVRRDVFFKNLRKLFCQALIE